MGFLLYQTSLPGARLTLWLGDSPVSNRTWSCCRAFDAKFARLLLLLLSLIVRFRNGGLGDRVRLRSRLRRRY